MRAISSRKQASLLLYILLVALAAAPAAHSQAVDEHLWVPNASYDAIARHGDTIYLAGPFTVVGPQTGCGVPLDAATGQRLAGFPPVNGTVKDAVSDGAGGWFIGGTFTEVGGLVRQNLAHIGADLSVQAWNPGANDVVQVLLRVGSTLYVGGQFNTLAGAARSRIGAVSTVTGAALPFNPGVNAPVYALAAAGTQIFAGGLFSTAAGQPRPFFAAFDQATAALLPLNPGPNAAVHDLVADGGFLYIGGSFSMLGATARSGVAAVDLGTGAITGWNPNATGAVYCLAVTTTTVYAGGAFTFIGGAYRPRLGEVDRNTGLATGFNPNLADGQVNDLAVDGGVVHAGGTFTTVNGSLVRSYLAVFDAGTGIVVGPDPVAAQSVSTVELAAGVLYAGGDFRSVNGRRQANFVALDVLTGEPLAFAPAITGGPSALVVVDDELYLAGANLIINGVFRGCLVRYDLPGHALSSFTAPASDNLLTVLAADGGIVYAGGSFSSVGGQPRGKLAAFDRATGNLTSFAPAANGNVNTLLLHDGDLYVGGAFTTLAGSARNRLGSVAAATGILQPFNPNALATVRTLAADNGRLYVGGDFTGIGGDVRWRLAAFDLATGDLLPWNPSASAAVNTLAAGNGVVWVGGQFLSLDNGFMPRRYLAALDGISGLASSWDPAPDGVVTTLLRSDGRIHVGGGFQRIAGVPRSRFALIGDGLVASAVEPVVRPSRFALRATNPFSRAGIVSFTLPHAEQVAVGVFDVRGRRVASLLAGAQLAAGHHELSFGGLDLAGGVYFVRAQFGGQAAATKFVVVP